MKYVLHFDKIIQKKKPKLTLTRLNIGKKENEEGSGLPWQSRGSRGGHRRFTTFTFRGRKGNTAKRHFLECFSLPHKPQRYVGRFFPSPPTGVAGLRQLTADPKFYLPP